MSPLDASTQDSTADTWQADVCLPLLGALPTSTPNSAHLIHSPNTEGKNIAPFYGL